MEELQRRAKKVTSIDYNNKIIKPSFLILYEEESEFECNKSNLRLQKAFFTFITQILQNFYEFVKFVVPFFADSVKIIFISYRAGLSGPARERLKTK